MFDEYREGILEGKVEELKKLTEDNLKAIEKLLEIDNKTYLNFARALTLLGEELNIFFTPVSLLQNVNNSEQTQEVYTQCLPILTEYSMKIAQNEEVYAAVQEIYNNDKDFLTQPQKKTLEDMIKEFRLGGVGLPDDIKKQLVEISMEMSELSNQFMQNIMNANNAFEMVLTEESDVAGIPESDLAAAEVEDGWKFTLHMPSYIAYMTYGPNREAREQLYKAYTTRAPENGQIIERTLELRAKQAELLGFNDFTEVSLYTKNAESADDVISFLEELAEKSRKQGEKEFSELKAKAEKEVDNLEVYDASYYAEQLKEEQCDYDENIYRPYFEKNKVVEGLFKFVGELFSINFKEVDAPKWNEKVTVFDMERNGELFARIHLDLEARKGKRDGAWMSSWQTRCIKDNNETQLASAMIVCNFPKSSDTSPSLLRHRDVVTLFHEMGHALHHLCSDIEEAAVSGINGVEWDIVEFPSQFLESFSYEKKVLDIFAEHYQTGEKLSEEMIEKLRCTKDFASAMAMLRQLEFGLFDMLIHDKPHSEEEVQQILNGVRQKTGLLPVPEYNKFQNGFAHIFSGGYSAGYYSYKWAERLSADAFYAFVDAGIFDKELTNKFYESVLNKGGSANVMKLFEDFMGRPVDDNALLRLNGIK